jgi:cytochrome c551
MKNYRLACLAIVLGTSCAFGADDAAKPPEQPAAQGEKAKADGKMTVEEAFAAVGGEYNLDIKKLFATNCAYCHQGDGMRKADGPKLAGTRLTEDGVAAQIKKGKTPMPAFATVLKENEIKALAKYIKSLNPE